MAVRGPGRTLKDRTVASDPLERAVTPEEPVAQVTPGTWDPWDVVHGAKTPAAVARGELDDRLVELHGLAKAHGTDALVRACRDRLAEHAPAEPPSVEHPEPKPFAGLKREKSD